MNPCTLSPHPAFDPTVYELRAVTLEGQKLETIATFRCDATAHYGLAKRAAQYTGAGEPFKLQILEDGEIIQERFCA